MTVCPLGWTLRIRSIESIENPDHVGAFARESCILRVSKIQVGGGGGGGGGGAPYVLVFVGVGH